MALHDDLLEQAWHLAKREPKRPKQASLRRELSAGYYALFHLLIAETTKNWRRAEERPTLARMFEHGVMAKVCAKKREDLTTFFKTKSSSDPKFATEKHILNIATVFGEIMAHRHRADYDTASKISRSDVLEQLASVDSAFASWNEIRDTPLAQNFLVTLLIKERRP